MPRASVVEEGVAGVQVTVFAWSTVGPARKAEQRAQCNSQGVRGSVALRSGVVPYGKRVQVSTGQCLPPPPTQTEMQPHSNR